MNAKKLLSLVLTLVLLLTLLPTSIVPARAEDKDIEWNDAKSCYEIYTAAGLKTFRDIVNGENGQTKNSAACAVLMGGIDLGGIDASGNPVDTNKWTPIGKSDASLYTGTFDGQGHTISGLYVNRSDSVSYAGLFGNLKDGASVKNLGVSGTVTASGTNNQAGGIAGYVFVNSGTVEISNCCSTCTVTVSGGITNEAGGIAGYVYVDSGSAEITNCYSTGAVSASGTNNRAGGIAGYIDVLDSSNDIKITNCYSTGAVSASGTNNRAGGIVGESGGSITNCYSFGSVEASGGSINHAGGIAGKNGGTVTSCFYLNGGGSYGTALTMDGFNVKDNFTSAGWDFGSTWFMDAKQGRPVLTAFVEPVEPVTPPKVDGVYEITSYAQLKGFAKLVNDGEKSANGRLMKNITAEDAACTPIGKYTGTFDGGGCEIQNLQVSTNGERYAGLFGYISGGTVKNLTVRGTVIAENTVDVYAGGIAGYVDSGRLENCVFGGTVRAEATNINSSCAGGIAGYMSYSEVTGCSSSGTVSASAAGTYYAYAGGFAGEIINGNVSACFSDASADAKNESGYAYAGGFAGNIDLNNDDDFAENCYSTGAVTAKAGISGYAGGFAGSINANGSAAVRNCYSTGAGTVEGGTYYGFVRSRDGNISGCYYMESTQYNDNYAAPLDADQFAKKNNFKNGDALWDFDHVWEMDETLGRPVLKKSATPTGTYTITVTGASGSVVYTGSECSVSGYTFSDYDSSITITAEPGQTSEKATAKGRLVGSYSNMTMTSADFAATSTKYAEIKFNVAHGTLTITDGTNHGEDPVPNELVVTNTVKDEAAAYAAGEMVTFEITATNIYDEPKTIKLTSFSGVTLAQSTFPDIGPGQTVTTTATYQITESDAVRGSYTNVVSAAVGKVSKSAEATVSCAAPTGGLEVSCTVVSDLAADKDAEFAFTVTLDDTSISGTFGGMTFEDGVANFELKGGETKIATSLPTGITYTVTAGETGDFNTESVGDTGTITVDESAEAQFTFTRKTGDLTVTCILRSDLAADWDREFRFTVTLSDTTISGTYGDMTFTNGVAEFPLKGGESGMAEGLPTDLDYTVTAAETEGFDTESVGDSGMITADESAAAEFTLTRQTGGLEVSCTVESDAAADKNVEFEFTVTLDDTSISGTFGDMLFTNGVAEFTLKDGESKTANGLPTGVGYTVETEDVNGLELTSSTCCTGTIEKDASPEAAFTYTRSGFSVRVCVVDIADGAALAGAHVQILDKDGKVVEEWTSSKEAHKVEGLKTGVEYTLHETVAPEGYTIAADTYFTIREDGNINTERTSCKLSDEGVLLVENSRTKVKFSVVDITSGEELEGAVVQIVDSEGNVVKEWTSTKEVYTAEGLTVGKKYTLHETVAPEGYVLASDTYFTIKEDGTINEKRTSCKVSKGVLLVENAKTKVSVSVIDIAGGEELADATVQILDKDGNVVEEWTSSKEAHKVEGLKTGEEYTLKETVAPEGYAIAAETTFSIDKTGSITSSGSTATDENGCTVLLVEHELNEFEITVTANPTEGGTVSGGGTYQYGATATLTATAGTGYDFVNWTKDGKEVSAEASFSFDVTAAGAYVANFKLQEFEITFVDEDGKTELDKQILTYGSTPEYKGETPVKKATAEFSYTFDGWTPELAPVTEAATYTAKYKEIRNEYTITFINEDGTVLQTGKVPYGETPVYKGATPTKASTATTAYAFAGWKPALSAVTGEATYTATFAGAYVPLNPPPITPTNPTNPTTPTTPPVTPDNPPPYVNPFNDVGLIDYFYDAVRWAVEHGVTTGTSLTTFSPSIPCNRAQMVTFLWRAAGSPEPQTQISPFGDIDPNEYYYKAVLWAYETGLTTGTGDGKFDPNGPVDRAQMVTFLWRLAGSPEPKTEESPFDDIDPEAYYYKAVLWAYENGITTGVGGGKFAPTAPCTRGQIVTFLYRYFGE